jgi:hypothetical protein
MIYLWEAKTGKPLGSPMWQNEPNLRSLVFTPDHSTLMMSGQEMWTWTLPQPLRGSPERILLWAQVNTGMEVDAFGSFRVLGLEEWKARRQRLQALGGPPLP